MVGGSGNLRAPRLLLPAEIRADVRASPAAAPADEQRLEQETANASGTHLDESDLLAGRFGHAPLKRGPGWQANRPRGMCDSRSVGRGADWR
jgi:hypothetical protein